MEIVPNIGKYNPTFGKGENLLFPPFVKGGSRGILKMLSFAKSPLTPLLQRGDSHKSQKNYKIDYDKLYPSPSLSHDPHPFRGYNNFIYYNKACARGLSYNDVSKPADSP